VSRADHAGSFQKGRAKTGGRQKGVRNRAAQQREAEIAASGLAPLDYMLKIMRDEQLDLPTRLDAAKAVAPYVHPRLAVIDSTIRAEVSVSTLTDEQRRERARQLIRAAFAERPVVIEHEPKVIAGRDVSADVSAQANGEQPEEREG